MASQIHSCMTKKNAPCASSPSFYICLYLPNLLFFENNVHVFFLKVQRWSLNSPKFRIIPILQTQQTTNQATLSGHRNVQLFIDIRCSGNQITDGRSIYKESKTNVQRETQVHLAEQRGCVKPVMFLSFLDLYLPVDSRKGCYGLLHSYLFRSLQLLSPQFGTLWPGSIQEDPGSWTPDWSTGKVELVFLKCVAHPFCFCISVFHAMIDQEEFSASSQVVVAAFSSNSCS